MGSQTIESEQRTRRSSEREPADSLKDKSNVIGGWLPSVILVVLPKILAGEMNRHTLACSLLIGIAATLVFVGVWHSSGTIHDKIYALCNGAACLSVFGIAVVITLVASFRKKRIVAYPNEDWQWREYGYEGPDAGN